MPETGESTAGQAQEKAKEVASQAQDKAKEAAGQARGRVSEQVDTRSTQLGQRVKSTAGDARTVVDELRKQGKEAPAKYVEQAADRVEKVGGYLEQSDGDRILGDVENFARRNPWAVATGGLLLGFAASRMLKASSSDRYRTSDSYGTNMAYGAPRGSRSALDAPAGGTFAPQPGVGAAGYGTQVDAPASGALVDPAGDLSTDPVGGTGHGTKPSQFESHS